MNKFLKTRAEVDECTRYIRSNNLISHDFECKNWDVALICQQLKNGDLLDMGSNGSFLLPNAVRMGLKGRKCGIDLGKPDYDLQGIDYIQGNLMNCPYDDQSFDTITCLSVIEHEVDYDKLAKECSRLLRKNGKLFITFDYWWVKVDTKGIKLYGLEWNILDGHDVRKLIEALNINGLKMAGEMNWNHQDAVINPQFCAPYEKSYTFGIMTFTK